MNHHRLATRPRRWWLRDRSCSRLNGTGALMPIRPHLPETTTFEPETIATMSRAFEEACAALRVSAGDTHGRAIVATRIIDLARIGIVDADALRERILSEARLVA